MAIIIELTLKSLTLLSVLVGHELYQLEFKAPFNKKYYEQEKKKALERSKNRLK
jgi:hypothetical protein